MSDIHPTAIINDCVIIGKGVYIDAGATIGFQGLLCNRNANNEIIPLESKGTVIIKDNVRIGANAMIQRGYNDTTIIGTRSQIDINTHIGHDCKIGKDVFIAPSTVIAGVTTIGDCCHIGIGAVIRNRITIGKNVTIGMGAIVTKDIPANMTIVGNPATEIDRFRMQRKYINSISNRPARHKIGPFLKRILRKINIRRY